MLTARTEEIDFPDEALDEILSQLDIENTLLKNAVGVVHCGYIFVESGFVRLLCAKLPFEIVGCTTLAAATADDCGTDLFSLSVLTSDDVAFSVACSEALTLDNIDGQLGAAYRRAERALPAKPALILAYLPLDLSIGVSRLIDGITAASGEDMPIFGALPCDLTPDYHESFVICNGEIFSQAAALLLLYGNVRPRFFVENVSRLESMQDLQGVITESDGYLLKRVNDMPFLDYIEAIGMSPEIMRNVKAFPVPFKVNYNEGTKSLIRILFSVTPKGDAVFAGEMPVGGSLSMQRLDYYSVMDTVESMANALISLRDVSGVLLYSCVGRNFLLGQKADDEMRRLAELLDGKISYHFCYAGSEICPLEDESGALVNHSHNYSFVACVF
ncbi:MAG: FIST C-terminal domain-containing protein [Clostridiales Family XIII bacterium]|nr:FIST C-terminal domain-containing protein [Clostridiales Family XIII bacterium]